MKLSTLFVSTLAGLSQAAVVHRDVFTANTSSIATKSGDLIYVPGDPTMIVTLIKTIALTTITKAAPASTITTTVTVTSSKAAKRDSFTIEAPAATRTWKSDDFVYVPGKLSTMTVTAVETVGGVAKTVTKEVVVTRAM